jgi:hypothetical protein
VQPAISFTPAPHVNTAPKTFAPFNQYPLSTRSNHGHGSFRFHSFCCYSCGSLQAKSSVYPAARSAARLLLPCLQITTALHARRSSRASVASSLCQPTHHQCNLRSPWDRQHRTARSLPVAVHILSQEDLHAVRRVPMTFGRGRMLLDQADATRTSTSRRCTSATVRRRPLLAGAPPAMGTRDGRSSLAQPSSLGAKPIPP